MIKTTKTFLIIVFSILLITCVSALCLLVKKENIDDVDTVTSNLANSAFAGFYSTFFFTINHYIYCKKHNKNFKINSEGWVLKSHLGWEDYFINTELKNIDSSDTKGFGHGNVIEEYSIDEYRKAIPEIYIYNENTKKEIQNSMNKFNLSNNNYDAIFIRRGDKLGAESNFIGEENYIDLLLIKNPKCENIYLQTDDYNSYKNLQQIIKNRNLNIKLYTLCDENDYGTIMSNAQKGILLNSAKNHENNKAYLSTIIDKIEKTKPVEDMNKEEKYQHVLNMIVGIDIATNSNICITDYQSNVSRFIKLAHKNPDNVYDVLTGNSDIDYEKLICPAYGF